MNKRKTLTEEVEKTLSLLERKESLDFDDNFFDEIASKIHRKQLKKSSFSGNVYSKLLILLPLLILLNTFIIYMMIDRRNDVKDAKEQVLVDSLKNNFFILE
mgnify:CR=1 FL=1